MSHNRPVFTLPRIRLTREPGAIAGVVMLSLILTAAGMCPADGVNPTAGRTIHWAYSPLHRPQVPPVKDEKWAANPIDRFILARLEREGLRPAGRAAPAVLLRRASYDLTGLPPSPEDVKAFLVEPGAKAWPALCERLLGSRAYGEQWARHWMDVARYADSAGYELDFLFTDSWKYRDWLIRSLQSNKPLDRFIEEQIAGDQLWPQSSDAADATQFLTIGPSRHEGGIQRAREREYEWFTDLTDTTSSVFLGSTLACSRCHDHKFDPFTQRDYYGMQAIFADSELDVKHVGKGDNAANPASLRVVARKQALTLNVLRRGELDAPLGEAPPVFPAILAGGAAPGANNVARRSALAHWLTGPQNPLAARVMVNRIWQWHFGAGLVRTPNDFGRQGEAPTHPELLDWLASELISSGWDLRHIHRLILDSATYSMSSVAEGEAVSRDSDGRLLSHFPRRRLSAEELRDAMLSVTGTLNPKAFGPPVVIPVDKNELAGLRNTHWDVTPDVAEHRRRSVYLMVRRSVKPGFFDAFNAPDTAGSCAMRDRSVLPSQALTLLNSRQSLDLARELAGRLWHESDGDAGRGADRAWLLLFGRAVTMEERDGVLRFLQARESDWSRHHVPADALPIDEGGTAPAPARGAAWVEWCLALLNTDEFIYVD